MEAVSKSRFKAKALDYFRQVERTGKELVVTDRNAAEHPIHVSSISAWDVAMLAKKGRLELTMSAEGGRDGLPARRTRSRASSTPRRSSTRWREG